MKNFPVYFNPNTVSNTIANNDFLSSQPFVAGLTNSLNLEHVILQINNIIGGIYSNAFATIATVFGGLLSFFLMVILSFYLAVEEDGVGKFLKAITTIKHEKYVTALWRRSQRKIGLWLQGQLILASIPAIAISFVTGGLPLALLVAGLYIIVHQFENQLIYPLVVKKVVGVSPVVSIVALVAGFELAGFIGVILAVPIAAAVIEFVDDFEKDKIEKTEKMMNSNS